VLFRSTHLISFFSFSDSGEIIIIIFGQYEFSDIPLFACQFELVNALHFVVFSRIPLAEFYLWVSKVTSTAEVKTVYTIVLNTSNCLTLTTIARRQHIRRPIEQNQSPSNTGFFRPSTIETGSAVRRQQ